MNYKILIFFASSVFLYCGLFYMSPVHAQYLQEWASRYNGTGNDFDDPYAIAVDTKGNVYVTGTSKSIETQNDILTIKYNSSGDELWAAHYNGTANGNDGTKNISVDLSGNVYVSGSCDNTGRGMDIITLKYGPDGNEQWAVTYDGPGHDDDAGNSMVIDKSGNVYVTGSSWDVPGPLFNAIDYITIKYNNDGLVRWKKDLMESKTAGTNLTAL